MQTTGGITVIGGFNLIPASGGGGGTSPTTSSFIGLANFSYTNKSYAGPSGSNFHSAFSEDGTKLYYNSSANITQYSLSTPFDISTAADSGKLYNHSGTNGYGFDFSTDGTKLFIASRSTGTMRQYALSTPWDISTASFVKQSGSLAALGTLRDIAVAADGSAIFMAAGATGSARVYKLDLSTTWDVTGSSVSATNYAPTGSAIALAVTRNGSKLLVGLQSNNSTQEYSLSSAFNLSSPTFVSTLNTGAQTPGNLYSLYLGKQDTRLLNSGSSGTTSYLFSDGT